MFNKKIMILTIILVSLFAVSAVSAADNSTSDVVSVNEDINKISIIDDNDVKLDEINSFNEVEVLSSQENDDVISLETDEDILSNSPSYTSYSVSVSDVTMDYGSSGTIPITISPASSSYTYRYDFYLRVYDSNNNLKINKNYYSSSYTTKITHSIGANELSSGTYTIKIVNYVDSVVMNTAKLIVKSSSSTYPYYSDYSVSVSDTSMDYGSSGSIYMRISPASSNYKYKYDFYLKVYDSNSNVKISQEYYSTSSAYSKTYSIGANQLSAGTYTIKIVNYVDNKVMDTAKLTVKSKTYIDAEDIQTTYGNSKNLIVTLMDTKNVLSGKTLYVELNGITYSVKTNSKGQISIKLPNNLAPKTYTASIRFAGDNSYSASSGSAKIVVSKITPKITVKSISGKSGKKVKLTATVKDNVGNRIKKCTVNFKVNGKTYKAKTNSKGVATVKVNIPKSKLIRVSSKIKHTIVTKTLTYKKTYTCKASVGGDNYHKSGSSKFKVTSKDKKIQKYKIVKKQIKTITIPYKKYGLRKKTSGHYIFLVYHEQLEGDKISVAAGDKVLQKSIKFSSNAYYIKNGKKVYPWKHGVKSKHNTDIHEYYYMGNVKIYVVIKYAAYTYKKL